MKRVPQGEILRQAFENLKKELDREQPIVVDAIIRAINAVERGQVKEVVGTDEDD